MVAVMMQRLGDPQITGFGTLDSERNRYSIPSTRPEGNSDASSGVRRPPKSGLSCRSIVVRGWNHGMLELLLSASWRVRRDSFAAFRLGLLPAAAKTSVARAIRRFDGQRDGYPQWKYRSSYWSAGLAEKDLVRRYLRANCPL